MQVLLLGATGKVGAPVLDELLTRGHAVTAVARDPSRLPPEAAMLRRRSGDVFDDGFLADAAVGIDVVVCSVALRDGAQQQRTPVGLLRAVSAAAAKADARLVTMGGAGSLRNEDGVDLVDTPEFPEVAKPESLGFRDALHELRDHAPPGLVWAMVSPPMSIETEAPRSGRYRTADDVPVRDEQGRSRISAADLAVAVVDEVETPKHSGRRFTVGY